MPWQDVCPSVRPSHAGILSKRLNISLFFPPSGGYPDHSSFSVSNGIAILQRGPPNGGVEGGMKKSRFFDLLVENRDFFPYPLHSTRFNSEMMQDRAIVAIEGYTQAFEWYQFE